MKNLGDHCTAAAHFLRYWTHNSYCLQIDPTVWVHFTGFHPLVWSLHTTLCKYRSWVIRFFNKALHKWFLVVILQHINMEEHKKGLDKHCWVCAKQCIDSNAGEDALITGMCLGRHAVKWPSRCTSKSILSTVLPEGRQHWRRKSQGSLVQKLCHWLLSFIDKPFWKYLWHVWNVQSAVSG